MPLTPTEALADEVIHVPGFASLQAVRHAFWKADGSIGYGSRHIRLDPDPYAYQRQMILAKAKRRAVAEMPYTHTANCDDTPASQWFDALTYHNPPSPYTFQMSPEKYQEFRREVLALDMGTFDEAKAMDMKERYGRSAPLKKAEIPDAEDIENQAQEAGHA